MTGRKASKKSPVYKPTISDGIDIGKSNQIRDQAITKSNSIKAVVKSVLTGSDILQESLNEKANKGSMSELSFFHSQPSNQFNIIDQLKEDHAFIDAVSTKVCEKVLNNETFKQVICDSISFDLTEKIKNLEQNNNELKAEINSLKSKKLEEKFNKLKKENEDLEAEMDAQEQYTRRNCILIHGLQAEQDENTDEKATDFLKKYTKINITENDIDRSHRLGKSNGPIIVKLVHHNLKSFIYSKKSALKGKKLLITESLTKKRMQTVKKMKELQDDKKISSYWTDDGKIFYTLPENPNKKIQLVSLCR